MPFSISRRDAYAVMPAIAVIVTLSTTVALAQPPSAGSPGDPIFEMLDRDRNGELSEAELERIVEVLKRFDRNKDGELTQDELPRPRRGGGRGGPGGGRRETKLLSRFDVDKNGWLNDEERKKALAFQQANPTRRGPGGRGRGGRGGRGGPGFGGGGATPKPGRAIRQGEVETFVGAPLYDPNVLRTIFIEFKSDEWEKEMAAFYRTDVYVPATVTVDGEKYESVGVSFRGNSSFFTVREGQKRSLNLTMDFIKSGQNLLGYRTLNLLNAHTDASFLRTVLYNHIARKYAPVPRANFMHVVINGKSWGIYVNAQQMNKEFTEEWFGSRGGVRWKIPAGFGGGRSMNFNGKDPAAYASYELKSKEDPNALKRLIEACEQLANTPIDELDTKLDEILNVDRALWFLALDNVLGDRDGYHSRGSDYAIYEDPEFRRFHVLPYDSNETFAVAGGGRGGPGGRGRGRPPGFGGGRGGPGGRDGGRPERPRPQADSGRPQQPRASRPRPDQTQTGQQRRPQQGRPDQRGGRPDQRGPGGRGPTGPSSPFGLSPFLGEDNPNLPLISRLLKNKRLRARYIAHVKTIQQEWLDWKLAGPVVMHFHELIAAEIKQDTRKLYSTEAFTNSLEQEPAGRTAPGIKRFIEGRARYLSGIKELQAPTPKVLHVRHVAAENAIEVTARVDSKTAPTEMLVYYASKRNKRFNTVSMKQTEADGPGLVFAASVPAGSSQQVVYYVEARRVKGEQITTSFFPSNTEVGAIPAILAPSSSANPKVVISEVMPANRSAVKDRQGDFDDWLELKNLSDESVDLSGYHLTDAPKSLKKWAIPKGTTLKPGACLVIWADNDAKAKGLHANFQLSKNGETVMLVDPQGTVVSQLTWKQASQNQALVRDGDSNLAKPAKATPGK